MSDFISRYQEQLHTAARRELRRRRRPRFAGRTLVAILFVALAGVGVPAAAQNGWFPFAGRTDAPTSTAAAPDNGLYAILGVLRRQQTAADRAAAADALKATSDTYAGVQTDYIRSVTSSSGDSGVALIPAESHQLTPASPVLHDVICMWRTDFTDGVPEGGGRGCYQAAAVRQGLALQTLGAHIDLIVPDGVTRVQATARGGETSEITPTDNVASWEGSRPSIIRFYNDQNALLLISRP
jgi:hypothetical protein